MAVFFRQHLQIIQFFGHCRFGNTVQELPYARMRARTHLLRSPDGDYVALVNQHHAVGDQEALASSLCDHDDSHVKGLLEFEDKLIDARGDNRI